MTSSYVVKLDNTGYYNRNIGYKTVPKEDATIFLKKKEARLVADKMRGYGWYKGATVETI